MFCVLILLEGRGFERRAAGQKIDKGNFFYPFWQEVVNLSSFIGSHHGDQLLPAQRLYGLLLILLTSISPLLIFHFSMFFLFCFQLFSMDLTKKASLKRGKNGLLNELIVEEFRLSIMYPPDIAHFLSAQKAVISISEYPLHLSKSPSTIHEVKNHTSKIIS